MSFDSTTLDAAMAALERQRAQLGDGVVDAALAALRQKRAPPAGQVDDDRLRQVSVLFVDVVGSTELGQTLDPESIHEVMDGALVRFTAQVVAQRGRVLQYAGDSLLAVFGAPRAHEDDAIRAVRAGLAVLEQGRQHAEQVRREHGHEGFGVRVGIHTGSVLLGVGVDGDNSIRGSTVNVAARMEQAAPPGTLRISQDTYRLVRGRFEVQEQAPLQVKGVDGTLRSYLVAGELAGGAAGASRGVDGLVTPMVGREPQLEWLHAACQALAVPPRLLLRLVLADAGLGKSRLLAEFRHEAEAQWPGALWLLAPGREQHLHQPYGGLRSLLCSPFGLLDSDPSDVARGKWLAGATPLLGSTADAVVLGHLLGLDFADQADLRGMGADARQLRERAFHHAAQLLRAQARRAAPLIAVFDDLQWADDGSLDFIGWLLEQHADLPLLLLALARPTLLERRAPWTAPADQVQTLRLAPLAPAQADVLATALLSRLQAEPEGLRALLIRQADGSPYYLEELVNMLVDQGALVVDTPHWRYEPDRLRATQIPTTLKGVLQARLDALPADARHTALLASTIGHRFWDGCLAALDAPLPKGLQGLLEREIVVAQAPGSLAGVGEYRFRHQLMQQVVYAGVLQQTRRNLHARVGHWLLGLAGAIPAEQVAEHFERGHEPALALQHWQAAAEAAAARHANSDALVFTGRALALVPDDDAARRFQLTLLRCKVLDLLSDRPPLADALAALLALAQRLQAPVLHSEALRRRARYAFDGGDLATALQQSQQAVALAPHDAPACAAKASALVAQCHARRGDHALARQQQAATLALARAAGDTGTEGATLNDMGIAANDSGDHGAALVLFAQALACHRAVGDRSSEGGTLANLGYTAMALGEYPDACAQFGQALALFDRIGQRQNSGITLVNLALAQCHLGQPEAALKQAERARQILHASGDRWAEAAAHRVAGLAALALQQPVLAAEALRASCEAFDAMQLPHLAMEALAGLAECALHAGRLDEALQHTEAVLARQAAGVGLEGVDEPMRVLLVCCQVLAACGDPRAAEHRAAAQRELQARAGRISDPVRRQAYLCQVPHHRALLALAGSAGAGLA